MAAARGGLATGRDGDASISAYIGATGSGKSRSMKAAVLQARPSRVLWWDPNNEYKREAARAHSLETAARHLAGKGGSVRYVPKGAPSAWEAQFEAVCQIAWSLGPIALVVDELADVTTASHAPDWWSRLSRRGRHQGVSIFAASQRPASCDKDFLGNCSRVRVFRLNHLRDVQVMAGIVGARADELQGLGRGEWIERDMISGTVTRGALPMRPLR